MIYKDGQSWDGTSTTWYENGQKHWKITYKDGELISKKCWADNGEDCPSWLYEL